MIIVNIKHFLTKLIFFKEAIGVLIFFVFFDTTPFISDLYTTWSTQPIIKSVLNSETGGKNEKRELLTVWFRNNSKELIAIQDIKINGIQSVYRMAAHSTASYQNAEIASVEPTTSFSNGTLSIRGIKEIPAGHKIQFQLIGNTYKMLLFENRVDVISSAKRAKVEQVSEISGFALFIDQYLTVITVSILTLATLVGAWRMQTAVKNASST